MPTLRLVAGQWKVWQKNCLTGEIRAADLSDIFGPQRLLTRFSVLQQVNKWNELSAHNSDEPCRWLYWLEE